MVVHVHKCKQFPINSIPQPALFKCTSSSVYYADVMQTMRFPCISIIAGKLLQLSSAAHRHGALLVVVVVRSLSKKCVSV